MAQQQASCPNCGGADRVYSQERVTVLYHVAPHGPEVDEWMYTGDHTVYLDETAEVGGLLYCRACDAEFNGIVLS